MPLTTPPASRQKGDATPLTGQLTATDVDASGSLSFRIVDASGNNSSVDGLTLNSDGSFSFDPTDSAYDFLTQGATDVIKVNYIATDDQGADSAVGSSPSELTGTNDAPVATYDASGFAEGDATPLTGQLTASDVDASGSLSFRIVDASGNDSSVDGLTLNSDGSFSFDPTNERFNYLAVNEQESVVVRYEVSDEQGGSNSGAFTIIVSGTNDAPTYTGTTRSNWYARRLNALTHKRTTPRRN